MAANGTSMVREASAGAGNVARIVSLTSQHWPAASISILIILIAIYVQNYLRLSVALSSIPIAGKGSKSERLAEYMASKGWDIYSEGYQKFKDRAFRVSIPNKKDRIVVPPTFLPELNKIPDNVLSADEYARDFMHSTYTIHDSNSSSSAHYLHVHRGSLNSALPRFTPVLHDENVEFMRQELPQSSDWSEITIKNTFQRIIAISTGYMFVGPELCHDPRYIDGATKYFNELNRAVFAIEALPAFLRPLVGHFLPSVRQPHRRLRTAIDMLRPIITERRRAEKENDVDFQKPDDMLQWSLNEADKFESRDDDTIARDQLMFNFSGISSTTLTVTNSVFTLASQPELAETLRADVKQALDASGGEFTYQAFQNMKKLDSFLKEVMRFFPFTVANYQRKVLKTTTLSNGQVLPKGYIVEVPWGPLAFDGQVYPDPETFDPLRFSKIRESRHGSGRESAETLAGSLLVGASTTNLAFGFGKHACPGRFIAANMMKSILANLLLQYEIRMPEGTKGRHEQVRNLGRQVPDGTKMIMIRKL